MGEAHSPSSLDHRHRDRRGQYLSFRPEFRSPDRRSGELERSFLVYPYTSVRVWGLGRQRHRVAFHQLGISATRPKLLAFAALYPDLPRDGALHRLPDLSRRCDAALFHTDSADGRPGRNFWRIHKDTVAYALAKSSLRHRRRRPDRGVHCVDPDRYRRFINIYTRGTQPTYGLFRDHIHRSSLYADSGVFRRHRSRTDLWKCFLLCGVGRVVGHCVESNTVGTA